MKYCILTGLWSIEVYNYSYFYKTKWRTDLVIGIICLIEMEWKKLSPEQKRQFLSKFWLLPMKMAVETFATARILQGCWNFIFQLQCITSPISKYIKMILFSCADEMPALALFQGWMVRQMGCLVQSVLLACYVEMCWAFKSYMLSTKKYRVKIEPLSNTKKIKLKVF